MYSDETITGRDMYLRINRGPVQHFRVWDPVRFLDSQYAREAEARDTNSPYKVTVSNEAEYNKERRNGKR